eukprot:CAMPEP_0117686884 /NCGR_PEP_ID=MMETSP0804-20121206/22761_1 /TAXON_ID=1074897 /ORGANISM="Tetraselmis astigmatica, Strain CCMP880" /LENGTH=119 /DNA_ID=CAMNT_0005498753 /DNA_START=256 /DNA_END=616 /DNA_ORIENTATION=+
MEKKTAKQRNAGSGTISSTSTYPYPGGGGGMLGDTVACLLEAGHLDIPVEEAHLRNQEVLPVVHNRRAEEGCHKGEDSHQGVEGHHKGVDSHRAEGGLQEPEEEGHLLLEEVGTLVEEA